MPNCYELLREAVDEASRSFPPDAKKNLPRLEKMERYCRCIDMLYESYDGEELGVTVVHDTKDIVVSVVCGELVSPIGTKNHDARYFRILQTLLAHTKKVDVRWNRAPWTMRLGFVFDSVWDEEKPKSEKTNGEWWEDWDEEDEAIIANYTLEDMEKDMQESAKYLEKREKQEEARRKNSKEEQEWEEYLRDEWDEE